jgi:hypothetical protein
VDRRQNPERTKLPGPADEQPVIVYPPGMAREGGLIFLTRKPRSLKVVAPLRAGENGWLPEGDVG